MTDGIRRRRLLGSIGAIATAGAVAGCSTDTGGDGGDGGDGGGGDGATPSWPSYLDDATVQGSEDATGESEVTVAVGPQGALLFEPTKLVVDAGTTVHFEFESPGHNVKPNSQPDGGSLDGTSGGEMELMDKGETYTVTLDTPGTYTYYCAPHEGTGMKGGIQVK
ncbi:MAG: plastocyanin/azurin family copper-binding protein [Halosimplex sp.]